jgi:hypothetical protein
LGMHNNRKERVEENEVQAHERDKKKAFPRGYNPGQGKSSFALGVGGGATSISERLRR